MRATPNYFVEEYRISVEDAKDAGPWAARFGSTIEYGNNGMFLIPTNVRISKGVEYYLCIVSDGGGWEHVSVSRRRAKKKVRNPGLTIDVPMVPNWKMMCQVKDLFWTIDETVVQYHPKASDYVNLHPYVLHLWKPTQVELPIPPMLFV